MALAPVGIVVLLAALLVGCGGENGDQALAERALLQSDDLPRPSEGLSWYSDPPDESGLINGCARFDLPGLNVKASAAGDFFMSSEFGMVSSVSAVYEVPADGALRLLADKATRCLGESRAKPTMFDAPHPKNVEVREISLPKLSANSRAYEIKWPLAGEAEYDELVLVQKGRSVALLWFVPELGCGGQLCGATRKQEAAFVDRIRVKLARAIAARM